MTICLIVYIIYRQYIETIQIFYISNQNTIMIKIFFKYILFFLITLIIKKKFNKNFFRYFFKNLLIYFTLLIFVLIKRKFSYSAVAIRFSIILASFVLYSPFLNESKLKMCLKKYCLFFQINFFTYNIKFNYFVYSIHVNKFHLLL